MADKPAAFGAPDYGRLYDLAKARDDARAIYQNYVARKIDGLSPMERVDHDIFGERALVALMGAERAYAKAIAEAAHA